jgi:uncharacterized protein (TIGR04255 family)
MYEDVCYKKTYLAEVIARIDFATPIEALQKNVSTKIMAKITKHFPIAEPVEAIGTHFEFGADGGMKKQETRAKQWNFFGKDRDRQLVLTDTSVFVRYTKYGAFEPFAESFMDAVTEIDREHPGIFSQRFGLRYINRFEFDGLSVRPESS